MAQFLLMLHQAPNYNADLPREKMLEMTKRYMAWADGLRQKGQMVGGEKLAASGGRQIRVKDGKPVLGICLGSQLIAKALGSKVYPNSLGREVGWKPLELSMQGIMDQLFKEFPNNTKVLHWHGDTFDLPKGAVHLQSSLVTTAELYARPTLALGESDTVFSAAKLFFAYGLGNALTFPFRAGATAVASRWPSHTPRRHSTTEART